MEEALFSNYQTMSVLFHEIYLTAIKSKNYDKAQKVIEKESALAELLEMGEYHKNAGRVELALAMNDNEKAIEYMESTISNIDTMTDYMKSDLYEHMKFREVDPIFVASTRAAMLKRFAEDEFEKKYY